MLKKMALHIGSVSLALVVVMVFASLSSILLGRHLPEADFGEFSLMRMLVLFIPFLAIWGQGIAAARFFSKHDPAVYRWPRAYLKIMTLSTIFSGLCVVVATFLYHLEPYKYIALFIAVVFFCSTLFLANLVRSRRRYTPAILMENGFRGLFFFLLLGVYFSTSMSASAAILSYLGLVVVLGCCNFWYTMRTVPSGDKAVPAEMHKAGIILMGIEVSVDVLSSLDTLLIPKILDYSSLGLYSATLVPAQMFNILARAGKYVWVPEFGRSEKTRFRLITAGVTALAILLAIILVLTAKPVLHLLYKGKYDEGVAILQILAVSGVFRLMYSLSSSLIVGRLGPKALIVHLRITVTFMVIYLLLLGFLLVKMGVIGAAWALLIVTCLRALASYWVVSRFRAERG